MALAVIGSCTFDDYQTFEEILLANFKIDEISGIISGGDKGTQELTETFAHIHNIPLKIFIPSWDLYGAQADYFNNISIIKESTHIALFLRNIAENTKILTDIINRYNKFCLVFGKNPPEFSRIQ